MTNLIVLLIFGLMINMVLISIASHVWGKFRVVLMKARKREEDAKMEEA